jgi:hypothetical protein
MNAMEMQLNFFNDNSDLGVLRQEFILLHASTEKVRRGCFAKVGAQQKQIDALKQEIEALKKHLESKNEKTNVSDLPLFSELARTG